MVFLGPGSSDALFGDDFMGIGKVAHTYMHVRNSRFSFEVCLSFIVYCLCIAAGYRASYNFISVCPDEISQKLCQN